MQVLIDQVRNFQLPNLPAALPPNATPAQRSQYDADMALYQAAQQQYSRMVSALTSIIQVSHDTTKMILQNFRV